MTDYGDPRDLPPHSEREDYPFAARKTTMLAKDVDNALSDHEQLGEKLKRPSCMDYHYVTQKVRAGEPCFVLRGQDKFAPMLVKLWAELNALNPECPSDKIRTAREIALAMEMWPHKKWPD